MDAMDLTGARDALAFKSITCSHSTFETWRQLRVSKGSMQARRVLLDGLNDLFGTSSVYGFDSPENLLEFLENGMGLCERGNQAAHNY